MQEDLGGFKRIQNHHPKYQNVDFHGRLASLHKTRIDFSSQENLDTLVTNKKY